MTKEEYDQTIRDFAMAARQERDYNIGDLQDSKYSVAPPDPPPSARELVSKIGYEAYEVNYMLGEILKFISSDSVNTPKDRASTENLLSALMESADQVHDAHSKVVAIQKYLGINEVSK